MASSVLAALDPRDDICEAKLIIAGSQSTGKFTVLVEGIDDVKVYERFFARNKAGVYQTYGCAKLVKLVDELNRRHLENFFIGIKDADYDVLNHVSYPYPNLFLTDKHDLETMMVSEEALEDIMKEYLRYEDMRRDRKGLKVQSFLQEAARRLRFLSFFRWYNEMSGCKLSFGKLRLSTMMQEEPRLDYACCIRFVTRLNPDASSIPTVRMLADFEKSHSRNMDVFHLLRGHDLCEMVSLLLKSHPYAYARSNVSTDKIEASLRLAYSGERFRQTQLYQSIASWLESHGYEDMMAC